MAEIPELLHLDNGTQLFMSTTDQFKTNHILVALFQNLDSKTVTAGALLPEVLQRGTRSWPNQTALYRRQEELFGASLDAGVQKFGEVQALMFELELPDHRFLGPDEQGLLRDGLDLLKEVIQSPVLVEGHFHPDWVSQEKENLRHRLESIVNDKIRYANLRCIQEMCPDEPYGLSASGRIEDLESLTPEILHQEYRRLIDGAPMLIVTVGGIDRDEMLGAINEAFGAERGSVFELAKTTLKSAPERPKIVREEQPVQQGKLCLGYRTGVLMDDPALYPMLFYNGILGGFVHSKLFRNVREKASLAYYANSRLDLLKGVMLVSSGIEVSNYDLALQIIQEQVDALAAGQISEEEMEFTRRALQHQVRVRGDSPRARMHWALEGVLGGRWEESEERLKFIEDVTLDQVVDVAQQVRLDTVYFLAGQEGGMAP